MNTENKKLIMFDFDGVFIDTFIVGYNTQKEVNENLQIDKYRSLFEGNINDSLDTKIKSHPDFFGRYDHYSRDIKIPEELKNIVKILKENYILTIISSTRNSSINKILDRENLCDIFEMILGNDIDTSKVIKIKMVLEKYNISPENSVFVTDTLGDILEANKCGVKSIGVTWGFQNKETLEKGNPAIILDNPNELLGVIKNMLE